MVKTLVAFLPLVVLALDSIFQWSAAGSLDRAALLTLFMMLWMVSWWVAEILPLGVTALIPMAFLPVTGILPLKEVTANYANPVIYLFLGGFIIARAVEKTHLNERIALYILRLTGRSDRGIVVGFMLGTGFLSMWLSNTATTVMMLPIAVSVIAFLRNNLPTAQQAAVQPLSIVVYLSIAYSANIGGISTPIGTPPNVVLVGYLEELYNIQIDFWKWMLIALPVVVALSALQFQLLSRAFPFRIEVGKEFADFVKKRISSLGPILKDQKITIAIFLMTCTLWIFKTLIHKLAGFEFLNDTSIAIFGGVSLFFVPQNIKEWNPVLHVDDLSHLPWNIVLLFGGGMAMASSLKEAGLIQLTTDYFATIPIESTFMWVLLFASVTLFLTEIMSNVALCVVALPVMMGLGVSQGIDPILVGLPAAMCSSMAFSMPISTPPNAIVFGTNQIRVADMLKVGLLLNLLGIAVVMSIGWTLLQVFY